LAIGLGAGRCSAAALEEEACEAHEGREKFWSELELPFECFVNCAYMGGTPAAAAMALAFPRLLRLMG
jgi:hypothetical protein